LRTPTVSNRKRQRWRRFHVHIFFEKLINHHQERSQSVRVQSHTLADPQATDVVQSTTTRSEAKNPSCSSGASTALNVFKFSLETLKGASDCVPVPAIKVSISLLLSVINKCQASGHFVTTHLSRCTNPGGFQAVSENAQGFRDLADRMTHLEPILRVVREVNDKSGALTQSLNDLVG
jgi:hypothetical protein